VKYVIEKSVHLLVFLTYVYHSAQYVYHSAQYVYHSAQYVYHDAQYVYHSAQYVYHDAQFRECKITVDRRQWIGAKWT
jgi:hypothetical protein